MARLLARLGTAVHRHRLVVLLVWLLVLVAAGVGATTLAGKTSSAFSIPGQESTTALRLIGERFGTGAGDTATAQVVVRAPAGQQLSAPAESSAVGALVQRLGRLPGVASATNPLDPSPAGGLARPDHRLQHGHLPDRPGRRHPGAAHRPARRGRGRADRRADRRGHGHRGQRDAGRRRDRRGRRHRRRAAHPRADLRIAGRRRDEPAHRGGSAWASALLGITIATGFCRSSVDHAGPGHRCWAWRSASTTRCSSSRASGRSCAAAGESAPAVATAVGTAGSRRRDRRAHRGHRAGRAVRRRHPVPDPDGPGRRRHRA